jgi:flavodoxin
MKALVTYLSLTGNTKKIAETIFNELGCDKDICPMDEAVSLDGYDVIFAGFPVWFNKPAPRAAEFLYKNSANKNIALFVTHASPYESECEHEQRMYESMLQKCRECVAAGDLIGFFHCRGNFAENAEDIAQLIQPGITQGINRIFKNGNNMTIHPDESELEVAGIFTRDVINRISSPVKTG